MQALLLVAEHGGPTMFARIGLMRAHVPRNGRLRKIPKKVQEFGLHLSLTGPVHGQGNGAIIHQARATGISVRIDKIDPRRAATGQLRWPLYYLSSEPEIEERKLFRKPLDAIQLNDVWAPKDAG